MSKREVYSDAAASPTPKKRIGVWDDYPRFLGIFKTYEVPRTDLKGRPLPVVGVGDHMVTCGCQHGEQHPKIDSVFIYVRVGRMIYTVAWPEWARF